MDRAYRITRSLLRPLLRHGFLWTIDGEDRIPATGPVLLVANHVSFLDPPVLAYVADRRGRIIRFLAMAELFRIPVLATLLRSMGQIPVERSTARAAASLEAARLALVGGACLGVFPEGRISGDLDPQPGRTGTARLARDTGLPVVPVGLWGTHRVHAKGRFARWRPGIAVVAAVGEPLHVAPDEHSRLATDRIMAAVCAQVNRARSLYPAPGLSETAAPDNPWWWRSETARMRTCRGPVTERLLDQEDREQAD